MNDLKKIDKNSASAFWNDERTKKWADKIYQKESQYYYVFNQRLNNLVELIKKSKQQNPKILECGFGGGQLAEVLLKNNLCSSYTGIDVSRHLCDSTINKLNKYRAAKEIKILQGSIDDNFPFNSGSFDIVLACGVFQYSSDFNKTLSEIYRVLKKSGYLILSQANINCFSIDIFNLKRAILRILYNFTKQEYQINPCYKAILTESFLGKYFYKYKDTKFFNSKFMIKGSYFNDYNYKKRIFSHKTMKSFLKNSHFKLELSKGSGFFFSEKGFFLKFKIILNEFLQNICNKYNYLKLFKFAHHIQYLAKKI